MKNIFKKAVGTLLATGMIVTMSTSVCATEGTYSTENQNAYGMEIGEEVYTIDDSQSSNYGITADVTYKNLLSLETKKVSERKDFDGFKDDAIVEIYDIEVKYSTTENGKEVIRTADEADDYGICGGMLISIPCDIPDLYVLYVNEGAIGGDVDAKYVDGRYVFYVSSPGSFMLSSETSLHPEVPRDYNIIEQTMVDPNTGITVSGMIPEGAVMYTTIENLFVEGLRGFREDNSPNLLKYDFPLPGVKEVFTKKTSDGKTKYDSSWYESQSFGNGTIAVDIVFVKDYEVIELDSELTVTMPLDYYKVLESQNFEIVEDFASDYSEEYYAELKEKADTSHIARVFQLNHTTSNLKEVEVLTKKGGTDEFKFKTDGKISGTFFLGNSLLIENLVEVYGWSYDDLETFEDTAVTTGVASDASTDTSTEKGSNINKILLIVCIATNAVWGVVFILKSRKKKANK